VSLKPRELSQGKQNYVTDPNWAVDVLESFTSGAKKHAKIRASKRSDQG